MVLPDCKTPLNRHNMKTKNIKTKRPWTRVKPTGYMRGGISFDTANSNAPEDMLSYQIVSQADFLRELYPSGHAINDDEYYPDIRIEETYDIKDEDGISTGKQGTRLYKELVPRYAFAFQRVILVKQLVHLCGNDIQFELNEDAPNQKQEQTFSLIRKGWLKKNMEVAFYEAAKSVKTTGDGAFVGYLQDGTFKWKVLSFLNGDTLYPHYDQFGKLEVFARAYKDYDETGNAITEWLEVWDDTFMYRFKRSGEKRMNMAERIVRMFGFDGYSLAEEPKPHNFPFVPVAYKRDDGGACWSDSQDSIDGYELSFSQMAQNNQAFGFPIMYLQGENIEPMQHDMNGSIKVLTMKENEKAGFLDQPSGSESYQRQLEFFYKMIYEQSFTVMPPEMKSGDLPAAALKILYSPAYEKAMTDAQEYQPFLRGMADIFLWGYGVECEKTVDFTNLPLVAWIDPYVHVNNSAVIADLASGVQNGFISKQTASKKASFYTDTDEWDKIIKEQKEQQEADLLYQMELKSGNNAEE